MIYIKVEDIEKQIQELQKLKESVQKMIITSSDSLETLIFKKYVECQRVEDVRKYINDLGYRIKTKNKQGIPERKYTANDISYVLKNKEAPVDPELKAMVKKLFSSHKRRRGA